VSPNILRTAITFCQICVLFVNNSKSEIYWDILYMNNCLQNSLTLRVMENMFTLSEILLLKRELHGAKKVPISKTVSLIREYIYCIQIL